MRPNPVFDFHRSAERAGYPAMLIVSTACLGIVVAPVGLLALTRAIWALAFALLCMGAAVLILAWEVEAALAEGPDPERSGRSRAVRDDTQVIARERPPLPPS